MAHNLIYLLGGDTADELVLRDLRQMTSDNIDVEIIADILSKGHLVMRRLGLDPSDTTPMEIYNALLGAVQTDQWLSLLEDTEYVLLDVDGEVISFNPIDVINNYHHQLPLEKRQTREAKRGLGWEITRRYAEGLGANKQQVLATAGRAKWPTEEPQFCRVIFDKPSVLVVGDITSEALIDLADDDIDLTKKDGSPRISIKLGVTLACSEVIVQDAVGGATNASVAFSKLGIQPSLMSYLGGDTVGQRSLQYLRSRGIDVSGVAVYSKARSNYHYVLRHKAERTVLTNYQRFDYRWREPLCRPDWIYLSMISNESGLVHEGLLDYLRENKEIKLAFEPGTTHFNWGLDKTRKLYERSEVTIMNLEEARQLLSDDKAGGKDLVQKLQKIGPKIAVITDGLNGAVAFDGEKIFEAPAFPDIKEPIDRTGAGDAFASTLVAELAKGGNLEKALTYASVNSMNVVQNIGSQVGLLDEAQIEKIIKNSKADYSVKITKPKN